MKWALLATASDQLTAEMWCAVLREAGIAAIIDPRDAVSFLGVSTFACRVIVPEAMFEEAKEIFTDYFAQDDIVH